MRWTSAPSCPWKAFFGTSIRRPAAIPSDLPWEVPSLKADWEKERKANEFSLSDVPARLLPDSWVEKFEATERPNQAFLRRTWHGRNVARTAGWAPNWSNGSRRHRQLG